MNHEEGAVVRTAEGFYQHEYVLRDHLGNTRVTFRDGTVGYRFDYSIGMSVPLDAGYNDGIVTAADIKQVNQYYPFGLNMEGNWNGAGGSNKYQYNGKELNDDLGLNWNHNGWRFYDGTVGRFWSIDPVSEIKNDITPYRYGFNNPLSYSDPDGLFETKDEAKKYAKDNGIKTGFFRQNKIVKQRDGSYAIENKKASTSISNDKEFGITTAALVSQRGVHLSDIGMSGMESLRERNPDAVVYTNDFSDLAYGLGSYFSFALPEVRIASEIKVASTAVETAEVATISANRLNHVFGNSSHALENLVAQFGSQEKAFNAVQNAANQALKAGKLTPNADGILPKVGEIINVGGIEVRLIGGRVMNNEVIISSFSSKNL